MSEEKQNEWAEAKAPPRNFMKWSKVGDCTIGTFVDKRIVDNKLRQGFKQTIYTLIQDNGEEIFVGANGSLNPQIFPGMEALEFGSMVKLAFVEERKPKAGTGFPAKIIKAFTNGKKNEEALQTYREKHGLNILEDLASTPF